MSLATALYIIYRYIPIDTNQVQQADSDSIRIADKHVYGKIYRQL
jgi:hypothetical protein